MEPTLIAGGSVLAVAAGCSLLWLARRSRAVTWTLVCASLVALSTRDLFRSRRRSRPESPPVDGVRSRRRASADGGEDPGRPLFARLRRRVVGWFL